MARVRRLNVGWRADGSGGLAHFRRVRALRGAGAMLGAVALLIQVWLPLVHHPALSAAGEPPAYARIAAFFGGRLTLCLAQRRDAQDQSGTPGRAPSHKPAPCPICQALHQLGSFVPPAGIVIAARPQPVVSVDAIGQAPIVARALDPTSQPRAPPVMA